MEDFMPGDGGGGGADSMDGVGAIANNRSSVAVKEQLHLPESKPFAFLQTGDTES